MALQIDFSGVRTSPTVKMIRFAMRIHDYIGDGLMDHEFEDILQSFDKCSEYINEWKLAYQRHCRKCAPKIHDENYLGVTFDDYGISTWGDD